MSYLDYYAGPQFQSKLESTQEALTNEASCQMYHMWKVQENLRSDVSALQQECLVKEYMCEVNRICESLVCVFIYFECFCHCMVHLFWFNKLFG